MERVQVQQHVVRGKQRAEPVGDAVLEILRCFGHPEVAVQVALTHPFPALVGQRIRHRHQGQRTLDQRAFLPVQLLRKAENGLRAAGFVPMHRAQDDQPRPGLQPVIADAAQGGRRPGRHGAR
jgi:hypothetical protein